jgi:hypothetical protein
MQFCSYLTGAAKPSAPAESLGLTGKIFGLGSLGSEPGACLLPYLGSSCGGDQTPCDNLNL